MLPTQLLRAKAQNKNMNITLIMIQRFCLAINELKTEEQTQLIRTLNIH